jgi:hypothetical protein
MVEPSLRVVLASLVLAGLLMALVAVACAQDVAYYRAHGVWWGTPPPTASPR